jgi:hypothetical protein
MVLAVQVEIGCEGKPEPGRQRTLAGRTQPGAQLRDVPDANDLARVESILHRAPQTDHVGLRPGLEQPRTGVELLVRVEEDDDRSLDRAFHALLRHCCSVTRRPADDTSLPNTGKPPLDCRRFFLVKCRGDGRPPPRPGGLRESVRQLTLMGYQYVLAWVIV